MDELTSLSGQRAQIAHWYTIFIQRHWGEEIRLRAAQDFIAEKIFQGDASLSQVKTIGRVTRLFGNEKVAHKEQKGKSYIVKPGDHWEDWVEWHGEHFEDFKNGRPAEGKTELNLTGPLYIDAHNQTPLHIWREIVAEHKRGNLGYVVIDLRKMKKPAKAQTWAEMMEGSDDE